MLQRFSGPSHYKYVLLLLLLLTRLKESLFVTVVTVPRTGLSPSTIAAVPSTLRH